MTVLIDYLDGYGSLYVDENINDWNWECYYV